MTRLLRVELSRLLHRRAILLLAAAAIVITSVIGVSVVLDTTPPSATELAEAERQLAAERDAPYVEEEIDRCVASPADYGIPANGSAAEVRAACAAQLEPQLDWFLYHPRLSLEDERDTGSGIAVTLILAITMMLAGTTFIGYDWASRSVSNQLLFEPRRARVWLSKALVVAGTAFTLAATVLSSYWLALGAVARSRDLAVSQETLVDCLQSGLRGAAIAAAAALTGYALTNLFRSTVATLGILLGVSLAGGLVLGILGLEGRWHPAFNLAAVLQDGITYEHQVPCEEVQVVPEEPMGDLYCSEPREITLAQGSGYVGGLVAAAGGASLVLFRRRDVP